MSQVLTVSQRHNQSPQQYLISTMVQSTADELEQLITQELEKNVALEALDPTDEQFEGQEPYDNASPLAETDADDGPLLADPDDASISDEERGDRVALEYPDDDPVDTSSNYSPDDDDYNPIDTAASADSFRDDLKRQIDELDISAEDRYLSHYIIDCLDEDGYLHRPLIELVDDLEFTQHHTTTEEDLEYALVEIVQQELEPSGIGARDLRECLILQLLDRKATPATLLALEIVKRCFDDLSNRRYDRIREALGITSHQAFVSAERVIRSLNPKPGDMQPAAPRSQEVHAMQVRPDFTVRCEEGQLVVSLRDEHVPQVRISPDQEQLLADLQAKVDQHALAQQHPDAGITAPGAAELREAREGARYLRDNIQSGRLFIDALQQRRVTLIEVMQTIVQMQPAYFMSGQPEDLRPMTLQDVAERCHRDISTISRVSNSKYIDTEFGLIPVKELFTNAVADSNQKAVVEALRQIIEAEDKTRPLTDEALVAELARVGYKVARRTVAKYREDLLGIPTARLRREL